MKSAIYIGLLGLLTTRLGQASESTSVVTPLGTISTTQRSGDPMDGMYEIQLDGKILFREEHGLSPTIIYKDPQTKPTLIVFQLSEGGNHCPAHYRIIDLTSGSPVISHDIGECLSDLYKITRNGAVLQVVLPSFPRGAEDVIRYTPAIVDGRGTVLLHHNLQREHN